MTESVVKKPVCLAHWDFGLECWSETMNHYLSKFQSEMKPAVLLYNWRKRLFQYCVIVQPQIGCKFWHCELWLQELEIDVGVWESEWLFVFFWLSMWQCDANLSRVSPCLHPDSWEKLHQTPATLSSGGSIWMDGWIHTSLMLRQANISFLQVNEWTSEHKGALNTFKTS